MLKNQLFLNQKTLAIPTIFFIFLLFFSNKGFSNIVNDTITFNQYKGIVIDSNTKKPLIFASLSVNETNISTVTNSQGEFLLKVPVGYKNNYITVSFLGYTSKVINVTGLKPTKNTIRLETYIEELSEVEINVKDALSLVQKVLKKKGDNYITDYTNMDAFYRETIKKRRTYVSLSEAVVEINKQPYTNARRDIIKLYKSRKSTDYNRLDTVAFKLKGGPFNTLYLDIMKNPSMFFTDEMDEKYDFTFGKSTKIDNRPIYVVNFKQKRNVDEPLFYGKLYIDANSLALTSAIFQLNLENLPEATKLFILKKPRKARVYPTQAAYRVDYQIKNNKWYYGYGRIQLSFKLNWDKKLFNTIYHTTMEMAVTNWEKSEVKNIIKPKERLRPSVIMMDEASGFSDPDFWGEYNVIEPEKPIESAIKKIQKQLRRRK